MSETVKQHFVPEVYLKAFRDQSNRKIWRWKKNPKFPERIRAFSSSQICHEEYFYEIGNETGKVIPTNHLEKEWAIYENEWESLIEIFESQHSVISSINARKFIFSALSLKLRNPSIRNIYKGNKAQEIADRNIDKTIKELEKAGFSPKKISEIEQFLRSNLIMGKSTGKNLHNNMLLSIIQGNRDSRSFGICEKLSRHEIKILQTEQENPFVTSDNPGFFVDQNGGIHNLNYYDEDGTVNFFGFFLPLTPKLCLFVSPKEDPNSSNSMRLIEYLSADSFIGNSGSFVSEHNFWTLGHCNESVFANNKVVLENSVQNYEFRVSNKGKVDNSYRST